MYLEQFQVEFVLLKHYLLQGVWQTVRYMFFYTQKSIWGTIYCPLSEVAGCLL